MTALNTHHAIEAVWRIESARLIAGLARIVHNVGLAGDLHKAHSSPRLSSDNRQASLAPGAIAPALLEFSGGSL